MLDQAVMDFSFYRVRGDGGNAFCELGTRKSMLARWRPAETLHSPRYSQDEGPELNAKLSCCPQKLRTRFLRTTASRNLPCRVDGHWHVRIPCSSFDPNAQTAALKVVNRFLFFLEINRVAFPGMNLAE